MSTKDFSSKQEELVAEFLGGSLVPGSGARMEKGDVNAGNYIIECKTHVKPQKRVILKMSDYAKLNTEALGALKIPVLVSDNGTQTLENQWCIVPEVTFTAFRQSVRDVPLSIIQLNVSTVKVTDTQISFDSSTLMALQERAEAGPMSKGRRVAFSVKWKDQKVWLVSLINLKSILRLI